MLERGLAPLRLLQSSLGGWLGELAGQQEIASEATGDLVHRFLKNLDGLAQGVFRPDLAVDQTLTTSQRRSIATFAVTGLVEGVLPGRSGNKTFSLNDDGDLEIEIEKNPNVFHWGFAVMYSLPYLQSFVRDVGLPAIIRQLIPIVEIDINNPLDRGFAGKTTGTINPGIIWAGKYFQLGLEAVVPINERTGKVIGVRGQIHFFLDDLFPTTIGRPLFNW